ncbi:adenylosuccinate synthase [Candidatus Acetothermia bacterium]|nr:adenylosuccinate synthase [Candidatus Acetothermia bacterium]MBI3661139.1 adenylosuccinate synthase [Candidatus Acetothermia bacterium]
MTAIAILGAQWGDEGKGKLTHVITRDADFCVRFNGGTNAGHRVVFSKVPVPAGVEDEEDSGMPPQPQEFKFNLVPSGALHEHCAGVLGNGMVIDPYALVEEIRALQELKHAEPELYISQTAHLLLPYHPLVEKLEGAKSELDTTAKGIGPAYRDKAARIGIRTSDLLFPDVFREKVKRNLERLQKIWPGQSDLEKINSQQLADDVLKLSSAFSDRITDTVKLLHKALREKKTVVFEGAQACLLDLDFGTYPYVTSSTATIGGVGSGAGVPPQWIERVIGITKAYTTRVGHGPFVTEEKSELGEELLYRGHEFGTITGRKRRCGWLDLVALRYASMLNGFTELALVKLDVLTGLKEIPIATAYRHPSKEVIHNFPSVLEILNQCEPIYERLPGWNEDISQCKEFAQLPPQARDYVRFIENHLEIPIRVISVGPADEANIWR